ncbi:MAG: type II toxin-antitoxin system death-on-curing family toxin [bacterium]|nr:type II toxin-antitoxin system death-on-curing family toxin [bacterium]
MSQQPVKYLSLDEVLRLHKRAVDWFGGPDHARDLGQLMSCLEMPATEVFGVERYPTLPEKAAAYCFYICKNHPFIDGNKRTALAAAIHFLIKNGCRPKSDQDEVVDTILSIAAGEAGLDELVVMFQRAISADPPPDEA